MQCHPESPRVRGPHEQRELFMGSAGRRICFSGCAHHLRVWLAKRVCATRRSSGNEDLPLKLTAQEEPPLPAEDETKPDETDQGHEKKAQ
jgi:hypothetical protein